jgi:hypothetical protein
MKVLKIATDFTSLHPASKLNSQGRVKLSFSRHVLTKRVGKTSEEELKKLANALIDGHG